MFILGLMGVYLYALFVLIMVLPSVFVCRYWV